MAKFDPYKVDLKHMDSNHQEIEYLLTNQFFMDIDGNEVQKGKTKVNLSVTKHSVMYELNFSIDGTVVVPCDRCLDDMDLPIVTHNRLIVKLGKSYSEESDEIVVIPADEGVINLAWFIYEFIVLSIPIKHVHPPGKCNKMMTTKLKKHTPKNQEDDDSFEVEEEEDIISTESNYGNENESDPRWDVLLNLQIN